MGTDLQGGEGTGRRRNREMSSCLLPCPSKIWGDISVLPVTSPGVMAQFPFPSAAATPDTYLETSQQQNMDVNTPQHERSLPQRKPWNHKIPKPSLSPAWCTVQSADMTTPVAPHHSPAGTWTQILPAALRGVAFLFRALLRTRKYPGKIHSSTFLPHAH